MTDKKEKVTLDTAIGVAEEQPSYVINKTIISHKFRQKIK